MGWSTLGWTAPPRARPTGLRRRPPSVQLTRANPPPLRNPRRGRSRPTSRPALKALERSCRLLRGPPRARPRGGPRECCVEGRRGGRPRQCREVARRPVYPAGARRALARPAPGPCFTLCAPLPPPLPFVGGRPFTSPACLRGGLARSSSATALCKQSVSSCVEVWTGVGVDELGTGLVDVWAAIRASPSNNTIHNDSRSSTSGSSSSHTHHLHTALAHTCLARVTATLWLHYPLFLEGDGREERTSPVAVSRGPFNNRSDT
jgi:hypothetical protein